MALEEFVGAVTMELDGREIDLVSLSVQAMNGKRVVRTMNRSGNAAGFSRGVTQYELQATVVIPADGDEPDWANIENAKITREPIAGGRRVSYLDCFTISVGETFSVDDEARRNITLVALREVRE